MKRNSLFLMIFLLALVPAMAQRQGQYSQERDAAREHFLKAVLPSLQQQRAELDRQLSPAEKTRLAEIRAELEGLRPEPPLRPDSARGPADRPALTPELAREDMANRLRAEQLEAEVAQIAQNHLEALAQTALAMDSLRREAPQGQRGPRNQPQGPDDRRARPEGRDLRNPVHFLLWDGQDLERPERPGRPGRP